MLSLVTMIYQRHLGMVFCNKSIRDSKGLTKGALGCWV